MSKSENKKNGIGRTNWSISNRKIILPASLKSDLKLWKWTKRPSRTIIANNMISRVWNPDQWQCNILLSEHKRKIMNQWKKKIENLNDKEKTWIWKSWKTSLNSGGSIQKASSYSIFLDEMNPNLLYKLDANRNHYFMT